MANLGALLASLSGKAGIKTDDDTLKKLLAIQEAALFELPEDFNNALERNLLTADSAIAHPQVRAKIFSEALDGVDHEIEKVVGDFEFDDNFKNDLKNVGKNTNEKFRRVANGLKDQLKAAKEKANKTGDVKDVAKVDALSKQVEDLNAQIANLNRMHETEKQNLVEANLSDKKQYLIKSILAGKPLPKNGLPADVNILTAKTLLEQEMAKNSLIIGFDAAGNPQLKQRKDGAEIDYFVDNKKVDFSGFVDGTLANNKFVQVNDDRQAQSPGDSRQQQQAPPKNNSVLDNVNAQLADLGITV